MNTMKHLSNIRITNNFLDIRVVITRPANDPALFNATVKSVKNFKYSMSVVLECHIYTLRQEYAESLLEELVDEGLTGEKLKKHLIV